MWIRFTAQSALRAVFTPHVLFLLVFLLTLLFLFIECLWHLHFLLLILLQHILMMIRGMRATSANDDSHGISL
jgi:hypothetical protein